MSTLFEVFINFYQGFLFIFFMHLRLPSSREVHWWEDTLFICLIGGFLSLYLFPWMTVNDLVVLVFPFAYMTMTQRGTWTQRILWTTAVGLVFTSLASISISAYTYFFGVDINDLMRYSSLRIGFVLSTNIAQTIILIILARIGQNEASVFLGKPSLIVFAVVLLLELVTTELIYTNQIQAETASLSLLAATICVFCLLLFTLLLYELFIQSAKNKHFAEMQLQTLSRDREHQEEMTVFYNEMLAVQHDLKKQITTVKQILASSAELDRDALVSLLDIEKPLSIQYITGNTTVDAVLASKRAIMDQHQIHFVFQPYPLQMLPIDSASFSILISNILDNAIEATLRVTDQSVPREIHLQFARSWSMFYMTCTNTMNPATIHKMGNRFISSKENKHIHGFGIESIRKVVASGGGTCEFAMDGNRFKVDIVLPDNASSPA